MKFLILLLLSNVVSPFVVLVDDVYVCDSEGGKKYHYTKNCRGLSNCEHTIIKVTLSEAKERGKTLCGWED